MSDFKVTEINNDQFKIWDELVKNSPQGTIFHSSDWLTTCDGLQNKKLKIYGFFRKDQLIAGCSLFIRQSMKRLLKIATSTVEMTPYGGVIVEKSSHYLFPTTSIYSLGFPYCNYIGLIVDRDPYFQSSNKVDILIDGPNEKRQIIPSIKSEIGLDTPCPIIRNGKIYLYYAVMDRNDSIWKTALSILDLNRLKK